MPAGGRSPGGKNGPAAGHRSATAPTAAAADGNTRRFPPAGNLAKGLLLGRSAWLTTIGGKIPVLALRSGRHPRRPSENLPARGLLRTLPEHVGGFRGCRLPQPSGDRIFQRFRNLAGDWPSRPQPGNQVSSEHRVGHFMSRQWADNPGISAAVDQHHEIAILGAGFAGVCMAIRLKRLGHCNLTIFEQASSLGGTWRDNTYPGCGCDVPSDLYSLSFEQNPDWSQVFASQQEILDYLRQVAARHEVEAAIRFDTKIVSLRWDDRQHHWQLTAADGRQFTATVVISGMGGLHIPAVPELPGQQTFAGTSFHTARWRHDVDLTGKRVAVIGTGASAVQVIPKIAPRVARLTVFQRTPPWILPRNNRVISPWNRWLKRYVPGLQWARRLAFYWKAEPIAVGFTLKPKMIGSSQKRALRFLHREVHDPVLRGQLKPHYFMGCKRVLLSDDYYAALTLPNVELVTRRVARLAPEGVVTGNGQRWPADVVIYATGFKPFNPTHQVEIVGRAGRILATDWADGPEAFKGVAVAGFPNFFMLMGPNSGLGHSSILLMIEAQVGYISQCLAWLRRPRWQGGSMQAIEVRPEVQRAYNDWLQRRFERTVWSTGEKPGRSSCTSWYATAAGRNFTLWPSFATAYAWALRQPDPSCFFDAAASTPASEDSPRHRVA